MMGPRRTRFLEVKKDATSTTKSTARARVLARPTVAGRLRPQHSLPPVLATPLPETEEALQAVLEKVPSRVGAVKNREVSDSSTSEEEEENKGAKRERQLVQRSKRRLKKYLDEVIEGSHVLTFLERKAISARVEKYYQTELEQFIKFADEQQLPLVQDAEIDSALVRFMNRLYFIGEQADKGEKVLASLMHMVPSFGRMGDRHFPRAWRCLKGWKKLTPGRSRKALPLGVWSALSWRLCCQQQVPMAVYLLLLVSTYARPNELLRLPKGCLVRPSPSVTKDWAIVLNPAEALQPSKTGATDETIFLNSQWMKAWGPEFWNVLSEGDPLDPIFRFTYPAFVKHFDKACREVGLPHLVPYQARRSGPSIDRSRSERDMAEVQKRGRWKSHKSLVRYESAAKLGQTWQALTITQKTAFGICEKYMAEILRGEPHPVIYVTAT